MERLANAIGMRCYGEDEFCERTKDTGGEQTGGKEERRRWCSYLSKGRRRPASTAPEQDHHGDGYMPSHEEAVKNDRRQAAAWHRRQAGGVQLHLDF